MKKLFLYATAVVMSLSVSAPIQAQSRKDKKEAKKEAWQQQQKNQREEDELRHAIRMDSLIQAKQAADDRLEADRQARMRAEEEARAAKLKAEKDAKKMRKAVKLPCKGAEFLSNDYKLRAFASREGLDMDAAQQAALISARTNLTGMIETAIQSLSSDYLKNKSKQKSMEQERKLESLTLQSIERAIQMALPICEEYEEYTNADDLDVYVCYMVIEIDREAALKSMHKNISEQESDVIQSDYERFKQEFKEHFSKEVEKNINEAE